MCSCGRNKEIKYSLKVVGLPIRQSHLYGCSSRLRDIDYIYMQCYRIWNVTGDLDQKSKTKGLICYGTEGKKYFGDKIH